MSKKFLAVLLAIVMVFSLIPVTALAADADVVAAPLGDTTGAYSSELLNVADYDVSATEDTDSTADDVTAVYDVTVTHPALLKHNNAQNPSVAGLWVGIGVPITTNGTDGKSGNGSSYFAFVTDKDDFSAIAAMFKGKDWAAQGVAGYSEWGWRSNENGKVFQWYNLADERYEGKTPYLVERNPKEGGGYTYNVYRIAFDVTEGHVVSFDEPENGTLTVKDGTTAVESGTPVAKNTVLTISVTPDKYFEVKAVKANGTALTAETDGTYSYTVAEQDVTISAEFEAGAEAPTMQAIGFEADRVAAYNAIHALGSDAPQSDITNNTMYARFLGLNAEKEYKVEFKNAAGETVYDSQVQVGDEHHAITGTETSTVYFTFTGAGSVSLKPIAAGAYTAELYMKDGTNWTKVDVTDSKSVSISKVTFDKAEGEGEVPAETYYEVGTEVTLPDALTKGSYIFKGWKNGKTVLDAAATYTTTDADAAFIAVWESDSIVSAELKKDAEAVNTVKAEIGKPDAEKNVTIKLSGTLEALDGTYTLAYVVASEDETAPVGVTLTETDGKIVAELADTLTVGEYTYTVDASEVIIAKVMAGEPAVNTAAIADISGISTEDKAELTTAMSDASAVVVAPETTDALTSAVAEKAADALAAGKNDMEEGTAYAVEISLAVEPKGYDSEAQTLTLDISPVVKLVPLNEDGSVNESGTAIESKVKVDVTEPVIIKVKLPTGMASADSLFVKHTKSRGKVYIYDGTNTGGVLSFTNPNGFSTFEVTAEGPVAKIGEVGYESLKDAIAAAEDEDVIVLTEACTGAKAEATVTLSKDKTVTLKSEAGVDVKINGTTYNVPAGDGGLEVVLKKNKNTSSGGSTNTTVTVPSANGGRVSVSNSSARKGDTVTITASPATGNKVGTVTVTDKNGNSVTVTDIGNNKYTFVMPETNVTVKVTFVKEDGTPVTGPAFTDVADGAYYADAVAWAVEKGITQGLTDTTFGPDASCTRAQMVTFLWRLAGSPAATGTNPFGDVASGSYYYDAVMWAVSNGITSGTAENAFSPDATVTRAQSVTFLYRYAGQPAVTAGADFSDVAADDYFAGAVAWAAANGITLGTTDTTFSPDNDCVRAQIVTFMYRYDGLGA